MMTAEQLKASILQLAMKGKLVEQNPDDEPAYVLLKKISSVLPTQKPCKDDLNFDSMDFDIPNSWEWVELNQLFNFVDYRGKTPHKIENGVFLITASNIKKGYMEYTRKEYISEEEYKDRQSRGITCRGDLLFTTEAPLGNAAICDLDKCSCGQRIITFKPFFEGTVISNLYMYFILSPSFQLQLLANCTGTTAKGIKADKLKHFKIPLPPLAEQKRIVAKIEELMPFVEQYAAASTKLNTLNTTFPEMMKKSILQEAVQGKLVPQDPNDEPASSLLKKIAEEKKRLIKEGKIKKQKPLPEITEDEIPFEIPESWEWVRLNNCMDVRDGTHDSPKYHTKGYPLVTSKNLRDGEIDFSTCKLISKEDFESINQRSKVDSEDILFAMIGTVGNPVLFHGKADFSIKNMALFKHVGDYLNMEYVYWFLIFAQNEMRKQATGGVQNFVSLNYLRNYLIPIPPANEQGKIVKAIGRIIPELNKLKV